MQKTLMLRALSWSETWLLLGHPGGAGEQGASLVLPHSLARGADSTREQAAGRRGEFGCKMGRRERNWLFGGTSSVGVLKLLFSTV